MKLVAMPHPQTLSTTRAVHTHAKMHTSGSACSTLVPCVKNRDGTYSVTGSEKDASCRRIHHRTQPVCIEVPTNLQHADHKLAPDVGPPAAWKSDASKDPWKLHQIKLRLLNNGFKDPQAHLAARIQAFNWRNRNSDVPNISTNTIGGTHMYCANSDFLSIILIPGFTLHTLYVVPGWCVEMDRV